MINMPEATSCPRCGNNVQQLVPIETGLRLQLQQESGEGSVPEQVCLKCFNDLRAAGSQGAKLRAHAKAKEEHRTKLWGARVNLVKQARRQMQAKQYSDAAVSYEKYIKTIEIVFDAKSGSLTPEHFRNKAHQKELTVLTSVLWDLVCIYDTSPRFGSRIQKASDKLIQFAPFTPIYAAIVKKAQGFERRANNPKVIRKFLKGADARRGFCFIATTVFANQPAPEVAILLRFRREILEPSPFGRVVIAIYYRLSPPLAFVLDQYLSLLHPPVRWGLRMIARHIEAFVLR